MTKKDKAELLQSIRNGMREQMFFLLVSSGPAIDEWESDSPARSWKGPEVVDLARREYMTFLAWMKKREAK